MENADDEYVGPANTCLLCMEPMDPPSMLFEHLRVMHPEHYGDGPELWPDGTPVIHDMTLEPSDFVENPQGK